MSNFKRSVTSSDADVSPAIPVHRPTRAGTLKSCLLSLLPVLGLCAFSGQSLATVYVCSDDNCSSWTPITRTQLDTKSTDGENTTIEQTLSQSAEQSITNGVSNPGVGSTNLYLKKSLWHIGGVEPFKGKQHVTAYIYKATDLHTRLKTCHAFSIKNAGGKKYHATCS
ncbi:hypothetical protein EHW64_06735 [Erwinia psidii]|uniref:hypothetical protein n=1 Tax=Erwinia psidii TaxID=69224 RepID=UPI00226BB0CD|nr:hypothetical protein [Erwinia psidii]MCX8960877.1 hypothetical protein [Erwinia psidii]